MGDHRPRVPEAWQAQQGGSEEQASSLGQNKLFRKITPFLT